MGHKFTATRFAKQRKELLKKQKELVYQREQLNLQLRDIRNSMMALDRALLNIPLK